MSNIWAFILQTISTSVAALLILIVKKILEDKMSPRWQYGIWAVLIMAALVPLQASKFMIPDLLLWIETVKGTVEKSLDSAYTQVYVAAGAEHILPVINEIPQSITDWIFVIYCIGTVGFVLWYLVSYIRLKLYISKHQKVSMDINSQIESVCIKYNLKPCEAVMIEELPSAFVCGIIKPLLVIPAEKEIDDKVILHELLHLKYRDSLQNIFWCILRALHWCNPFMQYVFNRIGNDMESLCDQRVLERLEGEERREYGIILLSMANNQYARMPGTSSISNGGKNISDRIKAIVRFKNYPKGMAVVSVCIGVILASNIFVSGTAAYGQSNYSPEDEKELNRAMALARIQRCQTVAAACDTYAKGIMLKNGVYMAVASSIDKHGELEALMQKNMEEGKNPCVVNLYEELGNISAANYRVYNVEKTGEEQYKAILGLEGDFVAGNAYMKYVHYIPLTVTMEDGWVAEQSGEMMTVACEEGNWGIYGEEEAPAMKNYYYEGEYGTIDIMYRTVYSVKNDSKSESDFMWTYPETFSLNINTEAEFDYIEFDNRLTYDYEANTVGNSPNESLMIISKEIYGGTDEEVVFPNASELFNEAMNASGSSTDGYYWHVESIEDDTDGKLLSGGGGGYSLSDVENMDLPSEYRVQIIWDENVMDEVEVKEVQ